MYVITNPFEFFKLNLLSSTVCPYWSAGEALLVSERYCSLYLESVQSEKKTIQHGFKRKGKSNELV